MNPHPATPQLRNAFKRKIPVSLNERPGIPGENKTLNYFEGVNFARMSFTASL